jgi:hypothetical protein
MILNLFGVDGEALAKKYWDPIANVIGAVVDWIVLAFTNPKAALDKLWSGIKNLGQWLWDNTVMKAWDAITGLFTFGAAEEKEAAGDLKVGETKGIFSKILHAIIPEGVFTFLKDPMGWVWVNILGITTGTDGKMPSAAEAAEQIKSGEADGIFAKVMGAFLPQGMIEFLLDPIDWVFVNVLKLGGKGEQKKSTGEKADIILGTAVGLFEKVLKAILPDGLVDLIMSPINWLFRKVLGIEPNQILDSVSEAHGVEKGDATGLWQSMMDAILPPGLAKFIGDPIGYIFTDILGLGGVGEEMPSTKEKSQVVAGVAVGLFKSVLKAILPDGLVDFIMKPLDWLMGKLGINVGESMASASEAHGVAVGDTKGLFKSILDAILPAGLVDFIMSPVTWLLTKVGITKNEETGELTDASGKVLTPAEALEQSKGVFSKVLKAILPDGLVDFIMGPWSWIKTKFGWGDKSTEKMDMVDAEGKPLVVGKTDGIFSSILKAILPDGLVDFLLNPLDWILGFLGIKKSTEKPAIEGMGEAPTAEEKQAAKEKGRASIMKSVEDFAPFGFETAAKWATKHVLNLLGMQSGGLAKAGQFALVGEEGPELVRFKQPAVVANNEQMMAGRDFAMNAMRQSMISQPPAGAGGGGSSTVMITNAPSTSNVANTKVETAAGVSDPHTQLAGVY